MNDFAHKCKSLFLSLSVEENASLKAPWQGHSGFQSHRNWPSIILHSTTLSLSTTYKYHSNLRQMSLSSASNRTVTWCKWRTNLRQVTRSSDASYKVVQYDFSLLILSCYHINTHEAASLPLETRGRCLLRMRSKWCESSRGLPSVHSLFPWKQEIVVYWVWEVKNVKARMNCFQFILPSLGNKRRCLLKMRSK